MKFLKFLLAGQDNILLLISHQHRIQRSMDSSLMDRSWMYLNTDGSVSQDEGFAAAGGLVCDQNGRWIIGFNRFLGNCTVIEAEL